MEFSRTATTLQCFRDEKTKVNNAAEPNKVPFIPQKISSGAYIQIVSNYLKPRQTQGSEMLEQF